MSESPQEDPSLLAPPHAVGPEKSVLSSLMKEPAECFPKARAQGVTVESFHLPAHTRLFTELARVHDAGGEIELVSLVQSLLDRGALHALGGPSYVTEIYTYAPTTSHFTAHVEILRDKEVQRGLLRVFKDGTRKVHEEPECTASHLARATEELSLLTAVRPGSATLWQRAASLCYDPQEKPPGDEVCLMLADVPVAARGNITVLQGKSKVGKSAVVSAILGAALAVDSPQPGDCLGFRWQRQGEGGPGAILHLDTEQSPDDWHGLVTRSLIRAGLGGQATAPERLISVPLVTFNRAERMAVLGEILGRLDREGRGTDLVVIDGIADLCASPNDEAEGLEVVSRVLALCHQYRTSIITSIHENPGSDMAKTRGHLGSELNRKAFANLRIDKDTTTGTSIIYGTDMRKREIPQAHGLCFEWDEKAGMHTYRGRNAAMKAEAREMDAIARAQEEWEAIFEEKRNLDDFPFLSAKEAIEIECDIKGKGEPTSETTMRKRLQRAEVLGVLRKTQRGYYELIPKGKTGNERERE